MPADIFIPDGLGGWISLAKGLLSGVQPPPRSSLIPGDFLPSVVLDTVGHITPVEDLEVINGNVNIVTDDVVVEKKLILGNVVMSAPTAQLRDCLVRGSIDSSVGAYNRYQPDIISCSGPNVVDFLIEDVTTDPSYGSIGGPGTEDLYRTRFARDALFGHHFTARRCDFKYTTDGIGVASYETGAGLHTRADWRAEGCWIHDLTMYSPDTNSLNWTHNDPIQWHGSPGGACIGCRFDGFMNTHAGDALVNRGTGADGSPYYPLLHVGGAAVQFNQLGGRDVPGDFVFQKNWVNGATTGLNISSVPTAFLDNVMDISDNHWGWDWRTDRSGGLGWGILAKSNQLLNITGNSRWGAALWLAATATEAGVDSETIDPFDTSVAYNVRRNG